MNKEQKMIDFERKYPKENFGYFSMILLFNDDLRLDLTQEQLAFLADLNLIQESDPELADSILLGYLSKSMSDIIETDVEFREKLTNYLNEKSEQEQINEENKIDAVKHKYEQAYVSALEANKNVEKYKKELTEMLEEDEKINKNIKNIDDDLTR